MKNVLMDIYGYGRAAQVKRALDAWNESIPVRDKQTKYLKMAFSPFIFFRGTDHLYWADFTGDWRLDKFGNADSRTWVQGDAHVENFGAFHNAKREIVYGLNDFDEAVVADYQYDVWRMAISIVLVAKQIGKLSRNGRKEAIHAFAQTYLDTLSEYSELSDKKVAKIYFTEKNTSGVLRKFLKETEKANSYQKMLAKWLKKSKGKNHFDLTSEKLGRVTYQERENVSNGMVDYGRTLCGNIEYNDKSFKIKDIALRLEAGTGSLGTTRYYVLIEGDAGSLKGDHILDIKHQGKPTPFGYLTEVEKQEYELNVENDAQRHAEAYKAIASDQDDYLGWMRLPDGFYSVRERSPFKETFPAELLVKEKHFMEMCRQWAIVLASGHERGSRFLYRPLGKQVKKIVKGRQKQFRAMVSDVAAEYADQVDNDWAYFVDSLGLTPDDLRAQKTLV